MKYIIDTDQWKDLFETKSIGVFGIGDEPDGEDGEKGIWSRMFDVDDIEELNSDYINEHFSELQDTAYQRGLEDGKAQSDRGCVGCKYDTNRELTCPCSECSNNYKNQWTAKQKADDKIEVGDEVNWIGDCFIVTRIFQPRNMEEQCDGIDDDGCVYHDVVMKDLEKTGRHFDISSILKEMQTQ